MSLDYGYGTDDERELAEAVDDQAETAFRVLHGLEVLSDSGPVPVLSPSWVPASAGACESTTPEEERAA